MTPTLVLLVAAAAWLAYETCVQVADWRRRRQLRLDRDQLADRGVTYR